MYNPLLSVLRRPFIPLLKISPIKLFSLYNCSFQSLSPSFGPTTTPSRLRTFFHFHLKQNLIHSGPSRKRKSVKNLVSPHTNRPSCFFTFLKKQFRQKILVSLDPILNCNSYLYIQFDSYSCEKKYEQTKHKVLLSHVYSYYKMIRHIKMI